MGRKPNAWYIDQGMPVPGAKEKPVPVPRRHDPLLLEVVEVLEGLIAAMRWALPSPAHRRVSELQAKLSEALGLTED